MKRILTFIKNIIIDPKDIRISIFNIMAVMGGTVSLFAFVISFINGADILNLSALLFCAVTAIVLLVYSKKTKNYRLCYLITTIVVYVIMFPIVFFTAGGLHSGMPIYFVFAVSYTVFMLENKTGLFIAIGEIVEYTACSFIAMWFPQTVIPFESQRAVETDIVSCIIVCCAALAITLHLQIALYHSQQKKTEEALKEVSRQSKAKDMFLANMSHEIRTPINMILGMSEMISRTSSDEQTLDYNKKICSFGKKLLTMIKDILDITKIQTGQSELINAPYSLSEVVNELTDLGNELSSQKGLTFTVESDFDDDLTLIGDKEHLLQVLENLVTNAFKYTEQGGASLFVGAVPDNSGKCDIIFKIDDTGIGIPDDALAHIYDVFYRVGGKRSRSVEGTGIGLAIVKELIDLMGGTIKVDSMVGVGTSFTVGLTLEISDQLIEAEEQASTHYIAPDCHVLAVDDTPENLELLKTLLGRTMMKIDTAVCGTDGIRLAVKNEYDIIILDYMMPEMDGIETLANMKKKGIDAVFIALTADAIAGTAAKMSAAGFAEYVTKPVDWQKFEQLLLKYIPKEKLAYESKKQQDLNTEQIQEISSRIENCELDVEYGLRRVDNSLDIYRKILILFCSHFKQNFDKAEKHMGAMEWEQLCIIVHSLKAQAKGIGSNLLFRMAETMEHKLKQKDYTYAKEAFPLLKLQWERTNNHSAMLADTLPLSDNDTEADIETIASLTEKAVKALKGNLWLDAREAVESLQKQDKNGNDYEMILQMIERFDFKNALLKLNSIREDT